MNRWFQAHWPKLSTVLVAATFVGAGATGLYEHYGRSCCFPGAPCCHAGADCCHGSRQIASR